MSALKNKHAVKLGSLGGKAGGPARARALAPERRSEIARVAARARWSTEDISPAASLGRGLQELKASSVISAARRLHRRVAQMPSELGRDFLLEAWTELDDALKRINETTIVSSNGGNPRPRGKQQRAKPG